MPVTDSALILPIGIFARTFPGSVPDVVLRAVADAGFGHAQFNLTSAGLETVPLTLPPEIDAKISSLSIQFQVGIVALSGTCNLCHPRRELRDEYVRRLTALASACQRMRIPVLTLSTGTRDPDDLWRAHPDNRSASADRDLRDSLGKLLDGTSGTGVMLAFEPEGSNIIQTADQAADLLAELDDPRLAIVLDLANLIGDAPPDAQSDIIAHAAERLRGHIALIHAKDIDAHHRVVAPGQGVIDFAQYLKTLHHVAGYTGPVIMHGLTPRDVPASLAHLTAARAAV